MHAATRRKSAVVGLAAAAGLAVSGLAAGPATAASAASISINDPAAAGTPVAGRLELSGNVSQRANEITSVLYVVDATASSTKVPTTGPNCGDVNADAAVRGGAVGDVLDCELAAVHALNSSLLTSSDGAGVQAGIEAFGAVAALADVNAAGATFAPPGDTGGETQARIITAATSIQHHRILRYNVKTLGGTGITYNDVLQTAQGAFATAPAGPKWLFLLSDGQTPVNRDSTSTKATLAALASSGIHLSSFAVGDNSTCNPNGALAKMAEATGERCTKATTPASLATQLTGSQPDGISGVTVSIGSTTVAADVNAIGQWSGAAFTLGAGSYTATATAHFTLGETASSTRTFSVSAAPASGGPAPGTVAPGPGALLATTVQVNRPAPSRAALPTRVTGSVGLLSRHSLVRTNRLEGATVLLQGRKSVGGAWATLGHATVAKGVYSLHWTPMRSVHYLRVSLSARSGLAASSLAVPPAHIWGCVVKRHPSSFSMTCHTTATNGSSVRLYKGSHVVAKTKVARGLVKVHASGKPGSHVLRVWLSRKHNAHHSALAL